MEDFSDLWLIYVHTWNGSFCSHVYGEQKAKECYEQNKRYYPSVWLIKGEVVEQKTYLDNIPFGKIY